MSERRFATWPELRDHLLGYEPEWVFRGVANADWRLQPSLERELSLSGIPLSGAPRYEDELHRLFRSRAHHYTDEALPSLEDRFEWTALFRHHGGPSRLLDVSHSPFIAAFFGFESTSARAEHDVAIWAIDAVRLRERCRKKLRAEIDPMRAFSDEKFSGRDVVAVGEPPRFNRRLAVQQALFLVPFNITEPFETVLGRTLGDDEEARIKLRVPASLKYDALRELELMNINAETLYGGLDGFARRLRTQLRLF